MTQAAEALTATRASETKLVAGVCFAHLVSHYYMLTLAPLFAFIRADFGVTYTELSLALTAFNVVSAVLQTPVGFFIDRTGARINLIGGLLLGSAAIAIAGAANSFWVFIAMFAVMGLANTVYHPADYALLSERVSPRRMTQVFSFHTCSGMIGSAIAPVMLLSMQDAVGWRGAFLCSALLGVAAALFLAVQGEAPVVRPAPSKPRSDEAASASADGWRLLLSPPILLNLAFFVVLSMVGGGLNQYLVVGLGALYGTPPGLANTALTGLLTMSAIGVLLGGVLAGRTARHSLVACTGLLVTGAASTLIAFVDPGALLLVLIASLSGFASGMTCLRAT
jgi:FSR family fosmidomycin resistance protein-like MFS transporter